MTDKKMGPTDADQKAFREAMQGVKKLTHTKSLSPPKKPPLRIRKADTPPPPKGPYFSDFEKLPPVSVNDLIHYAVPGLQPKTLKKLRQGQYPIEAVLDLHGNTVEEARHALSTFLVNCQQHNQHHVLIVHGKGRHYDKPILKNKLNHWLRQTNQVLAFSSAVAKDGNTGALYVLLRK